MSLLLRRSRLLENPMTSKWLSDASCVHGTLRFLAYISWVIQARGNISCIQKLQRQSQRRWLCGLEVSSSRYGWSATRQFVNRVRFLVCRPAAQRANQL